MGVIRLCINISKFHCGTKTVRDVAGISHVRSYYKASAPMSAAEWLK